MDQFKLDQNNNPQNSPVAGDYLDNLPGDLVERAVKATIEEFGVDFGPAHIKHLNAEQLTFFAQLLFPNKQIGRATYKVERGADGFDYFFIIGYKD